MKKYRRIIMLSLSLVLFLGGIGIIQNYLDQDTNFEDESVVKVEENKNTEENKAQTVEVLKSPVDENVGIVRYFYNKDDDSSKQEQSLILFEGVYRPNLGIDYSNGNQSFNVYASISGTVTKKTQDPILGWIVTISNDSGVSITYQALSKVDVELNKEVVQGDTIGVSGENIYEADLKNHLHFILEKDGIVYNPENYIGKQITMIK